MLWTSWTSSSNLLQSIRLVLDLPKKEGEGMHDEGMVVRQLETG